MFLSSSEISGLTRLMIIARRERGKVTTPDLEEITRFGTILGKWGRRIRPLQEGPY
jgi:hypothetical protein